MKMIDPYRLATIQRDGVDTAMVERCGRLLPVAALLPELEDPLHDLAPVLADWPRWSARLDERVDRARFESDGTNATEASFRPPIALPNKLICIGANYHDHIAEMPIPITPNYPYAFLKPPSTTLRGSGEAVEAPANVQMFDWEAELAVVIGVRARHVPADRALEVVAAYANLNDLSARDWIASRPPIGVDWIRHKAYDGFAPMGPYLLPTRFVVDPQNVPITLSVNGIVKQNSNTAQMVYGIAAIIEHLSSIMTLEPGDVIATGTPAGVGHGRTPAEYLKPGDEIRIEIGGCGVLVTPITAPG